MRLKAVAAGLAVAAALIVPAAGLANGRIYASTASRAGTAATSLLGYPCTLLLQVCRQRALYKPRGFVLGSHYTFENTRWTQWGRFGASAQTTLFSLFQGSRRRVRTTVVFSRPQRMCGVMTFTEWNTGSGDSAKMFRSGGMCFFIVQQPDTGRGRDQQPRPV